MKQRVLIGTSKGVFVADSDGRTGLRLSGPLLPGSSVYSVAWDGRNRTALVSVDGWKKPSLHSSEDLDSWKELAIPSFPKGGRQEVKRIWKVEPGPKDEPDVLYAGVEPAALFRSDDYGKRWQSFPALHNHRTRKMWMPGAGGLCLNSIVQPHQGDGKLYVSISTGGVFSSTDEGETWNPMNEGTRADFLPAKYPEAGQCVHRLVTSGVRPFTLYQQNHCGVYSRGEDDSKWNDITRGLPSDFGMTIVSHPHDARRLYVIPIESGIHHYPPAGKLAVFESRNGGKTWQEKSTGLPQPPCYTNVLRDAFVSDRSTPCRLFFGTNTGQLFFSLDEGENWRQVEAILPPIQSVAVTS